MAKLISNVVLMPAVEGISRKLALRRETCTEHLFVKGGGEAGGSETNTHLVPGNTYMGIVSTVKNVIGIGDVRVNNLFMRKSTKLPVITSAQLDARQNFIDVNAWVLAAKSDLMAITQNQAKFRAAKADLSKTISGVSAYGYQGMTGWMKGVCFGILRAGGTLPQDHNLPAFDA